MTETAGSLARGKIVRLLNPDLVVPITFEMWEDRILPVLSELEQRGTTRTSEYTVENEKIHFVGNDQNLLKKLEARDLTGSGKNPDMFLVAFSGLTELSVLRRFKDYPDETGRAQLEEPWVAECAEARSMVVLNSGL